MVRASGLVNRGAGSGGRLRALLCRKHSVVVYHLTKPPDKTVALLILCALALLVRAWGLGEQSFSMDELAELGIASGTPSEIVTASDGFPPLFNLLLSWWLNLFGSDSFARWLSVLFGVATVPVVWLLGNDLGGRRVAVSAAAVVAVMPVHVWFSQEARAYSLLVLLAGLTLWTFCRAQECGQTRYWSSFAFFGAAGLYTHYFFAGLLASVFLLLVLEWRNTERAARGVWAFAALLVAATPAALLIGGDLGYQTVYPRTTPFDLGALFYTYLSMFTGFTIGPSVRDLHSLGLRDATVGLLPWLVPILIAVVPLVTRGVPQLSGSLWLRRLLVLGIVPVVAVAAVTQVAEVGYRVRYVAWVLVPIALWVGAGLGRPGRSRIVQVATVALAIVFAVALVNRRYNDRYRVEDAEAAARFVARSDQLPVPLYVTANYMAKPLAYYLPPGWPVWELPAPTRDTGDVREALAVIIAAADSGAFNLAYTREFDGDPAGRLLNKLLEMGVVVPEANFAGIRLFKGVERRRD